jgi:hypothetical protein
MAMKTIHTLAILQLVTLFVALDVQYHPWTVRLMAAVAHFDGYLAAVPPIRAQIVEVAGQSVRLGELEGASMPGMVIF